MQFGWRVRIGTIDLDSGQDYIDVFERRKGDWPEGTTIAIKWANGTSWPAVISGKTATWKVEAPAAALIPGDMAYQIKVTYPDGGQTADYVWFRGYSRRTY